MLPDQIEEGEVSEPELDDQPDSDTGDRDKVLSEDQNYRESVYELLWDGPIFQTWNIHLPPALIIHGLVTVPSQ